MKNTLGPVQRMRNLRPSSDAALARASYDRAVVQSNAAWGRLGERAALYPGVRARLLTVIAVEQQRMADGYRRGYGLGWPEADQVAGVHEDIGELLHLLASTSAAEGEPWSRVRGRQDWEEAFGSVLDDLTKAAAHATVYAEVLTRLWFPAAQHLTAEVAEVITHLITSIFHAADNTTQAADRKAKSDLES